MSQKENMEIVHPQEKQRNQRLHIIEGLKNELDRASEPSLENYDSLERMVVPSYIREITSDPDEGYRLFGKEESAYRGELRSLLKQCEQVEMNYGGKGSIDLSSRRHAEVFELEERVRNMGKRRAEEVLVQGFMGDFDLPYGYWNDLTVLRAKDFKFKRRDLGKDVEALHYQREGIRDTGVTLDIVGYAEGGKIANPSMLLVFHKG